MDVVPHPVAFYATIFERLLAPTLRVTRTFPQNAAVMTSDGTILA
jgi:hypothetical protein